MPATKPLKPDTKRHWRLITPLSDADIHAIRMARGVLTLAHLAKKYDRSVSTINNIQLGRASTNVPLTPQERQRASASVGKSGRYGHEVTRDVVLVALEDVKRQLGRAYRDDLKEFIPAMNILIDAVKSLEP